MCNIEAVPWKPQRRMGHKFVPARIFFILKAICPWLITHCCWLAQIFSVNLQYLPLSWRLCCRSCRSFHSAAGVGVGRWCNTVTWRLSTSNDFPSHSRETISNSFFVKILPFFYSLLAKKNAQYTCVTKRSNIPTNCSFLKTFLTLRIQV